ncbi:MAG: YidC/Oxa1 family membrane protein insertase [Phototrophicaceae bacterium]
MWDLIVNPFITILTLFYSLLGQNIVLAIAVFTVVIRLLTSPLLLQQQRSAAAMKEVQPRLKKIQEKYKNDREKLAQEQMALYKEAGVNPLGGCLPLFIQLPILLGLYQAIIKGLAGTPFQLIDLSGRLMIPGLDHLVPLNNMWLNMDLTLAPTSNPAYALSLPVLVVVTTWLQSKLTMPTMSMGDAGGAAASMTRSMTTIMPLMFGFFSLSFSVGLSIYFVVSNVVGIIQYSLMGKAEWGALFNRQPAAAPAGAPAVVEGKAAPVPSGARAKKMAAEPSNATETSASANNSNTKGAAASGSGDVVLTPRASRGKPRKMRKLSNNT